MTTRIFLKLLSRPGILIARNRLYSLSTPILLQKKNVQSLVTKSTDIKDDFQLDTSKLELLLKKSFVLDQSFSLYGGVQGLVDLGPVGCAIKSNLIQLWRRFFIHEEQMSEVDCSILTPEYVLKASGHVDRFTDLVVRDISTGECFRADHLIKNVLMNRLSTCTAEEKSDIATILQQLDNFQAPEIDEIIDRFHIKSPKTSNSLTKSQEFNLMFPTNFGPSGAIKGYLRPETAQGIFVNFQRLFEFHQNRLPFAVAQIGQAFRNEISPRSGLLRSREFTMAEIEHFFDPKCKSHAKFAKVANLAVNLYSAQNQAAGQPFVKQTLQEAVTRGILANESLAYFLGRIQQFLLRLGIDPHRLRFRQHMSNEKAHYSNDCWDAECLSSAGWIECVGCADRGCFDLTRHAAASGHELVAHVPLASPQITEAVKCIPVKSAIHRSFRKSADEVVKLLKNLSDTQLMKLQSDLEKSEIVAWPLADDGRCIELHKSMMKFEKYQKRKQDDSIIPHVIEPSFGIGRILHCIFEHTFCIREGDEDRSMLALPMVLAPYMCSVLPLSKKTEFVPLTEEISEKLLAARVTYRVDATSGTIGRRYAKTDQIGIPFGITIDFDSLNMKPASVTVRERDSMKQVRVPVSELSCLMSNLANGFTTWQDVLGKYPLFQQQESH